ncbi:MAG: methyltransferase [Chloroflexi bacterium]|nr:methyltransferase [Chloroflexota bacterium]
MPGLEELAMEEIRAAIPEARPITSFRRFDDRTSILEFSGTRQTRLWLRLRTVEDVFILAARGRDIRHGSAGLSDISAVVLKAARVDDALRGFMQQRRAAPKTFRVVARLSGAQGFRRVDAQSAVESALRQRWRGVRPASGDEADVEAWLSIVGGMALVGVRVSGGEMRALPEGVRPLPGSLKPAVARAMVLLSEPKPTDFVVDPFCGAGTLLIERGLTEEFAALLGGDSDRSAAQRARVNARAAGVNMAVKQWDALELPLETASVDVILTNPPFGRQFGLPDGAVDPAALYARFLSQVGRVLRAEGRAAILTAAQDALEGALAGTGLRVQRRVGLGLRGLPATIYLLRRG